MEDVPVRRGARKSHAGQCSRPDTELFSGTAAARVVGALPFCPPARLAMGLNGLLPYLPWPPLPTMSRFAAEMQAKGWRATRRANSAMIDPFWQAKDWKGVVEVCCVLPNAGRIGTLT